MRSVFPVLEGLSFVAVTLTHFPSSPVANYVVVEVVSETLVVVAVVSSSLDPSFHSEVGTDCSSSPSSSVVGLVALGDVVESISTEDSG